MDFLTTILDILGEHGSTLFESLIQVVGGFALLATVTANQTDDKIVNSILKVINFLGGNVGKAKNDPKEQ